MLVNAARQGMTVAEVPAPYGVRLGESKLNTVRDGWRHLRFLLVAAPDFLFVLPGLAALRRGTRRSRRCRSSRRGNRDRVAALAAGLRRDHPPGNRGQPLLFGLMTKAYLVRRGLQKAGRAVQAYRRLFTLERTLLLALVMIGFGLILDGGLLVVWTSGAKADNGLQLAALAQSLIIVGANSGHGRIPPPRHRRAGVTSSARSLPESRRLRIAFVYDALFPYVSGGAERRYHELAERLAARHDVHFFSWQYSGGARRPAPTSVAGSPYHAVGPARPFYGDDGKRTIREATAFASHLLPILGRRRFDVVDASATPYLPLFAAWLATRLTGTPLVATWHEYWGAHWPEYLPDRPIVARAARLVEAGARPLADLGSPSRR